MKTLANLFSTISVTTKSLFILLLTLIVMSGQTSYAQESLSPHQEISAMGDKLFSRISNSQQELDLFPELMREIVEEELMPTVDVKYAAYKVLGKHLKKTTKQQRSQFVKSMDSYLVRSFSSVLQRYNNQQITYQKSNVKPGSKMASVNAVISDSNQPDIHLTFQMRKNKKTGQWKAYDLAVEGISLLSSKQAEFKSRIAKFGIDQVTIELAALTQ